MDEYLRWFDTKVQGRKVLLLLDNFSGHEALFWVASWQVRHLSIAAPFAH